MPDPLDTKIHPRRKPRMQSSGAAGDSSSISRRCGPGQPGSQRRHRRGKEKRGDSPIRPGATPRDLSFRATWKLALRRARGKTNRGNPANPTEGKSGRCRCRGNSGRPPDGAGRSAKRGDLQSRLSAIPKDRKRGQPHGRPVGTAEGCEVRGDSKLHRRQKPEMQDEGKPEAGIRGEARGREESGKPGAAQNQRRGNERDSGRLEDQSPAQPKDDDARQLADSSPKRPKDAGRGNLRTHCWLNRKMQGAG